jgi:uncharacterized sporulation protein YeaH/YhbH (DUF444 family)
MIVPIAPIGAIAAGRRSRSRSRTPLIVYMMDVSGSMGDEQKELVRLEAFWIDAWLRRNYEGIESRYIVHDVRAAEVDRETFFRIREDGGTKISSASTAAGDPRTHYDPPSGTSICFTFPTAITRRERFARMLPSSARATAAESNMFGYCQVASAYGSGQFHQRAARAPQRRGEHVITSRVNTKDDILRQHQSVLREGAVRGADAARSVDC